MRREHGAAWVITQFFAVSVAQHGMLVGLTLPLQAAMAADAAPLGPLDMVACAICVMGIAIGCIADNQLRAYMLISRPKPLVLETGEIRAVFSDLFGCADHGFTLHIAMHSCT
jgi:steroid 5-alpha reductase family enzyme